jgi:hypothetical protein
LYTSRNHPVPITSKQQLADLVAQNLRSLIILYNLIDVSPVLGNDDVLFVKGLVAAKQNQRRRKKEEEKEEEKEEKEEKEPQYDEFQDMIENVALQIGKRIGKRRGKRRRKNRVENVAQSSDLNPNNPARAQDGK